MIILRKTGFSKNKIKFVAHIKFNLQFKLQIMRRLFVSPVELK
jgi:hypothetical protein